MAGGVLKILGLGWRAAIGAACLAASAGFAAAAAPKPAPATDPLTFALAQLKSGTIDFDANCPGNPTHGLADATSDAPEAYRPPAWQSPCRTLTATGFGQLLAKAAAAGSLTIEGFNLIADPRDQNHWIEFATLDFPLRLRLAYGRFGDRLYLDNSHFTALDIDNTDFAGPLNAETLSVDGALKLDNDHVAGLADLADIKAASVMLSSFYGDDGLIGAGAAIGGNLILQHKISFQSISFTGAGIGKSLVIEEITGRQAGDISCRQCQIGEDLALGDLARPSEFGGEIDVSDSKIANGLAIRNATFDRLVNLENVTVANVAMSEDMFRKPVWANYLTAQGFVLGAGVRLAELHLSGAEINKELDISGAGKSSWPSTGLLDVSDAHIAAFSDCENSWPANLNLTDFHYDSISLSREQGDPGNPPQPSCNRIGQNGKTSSVAGWLQFLGKYRPADFDPQPYTYLAKYFKDLGNVEYANAILFASRKHQMYDALRHGEVLHGIGLAILYVFAGFGIGAYAIEHLLLTVGFTVLFGIFVLGRAARARQKGLLWCTGACVQRLLPIVKFFQEFDDYFDQEDDPWKDREDARLYGVKLSGRQKVFFFIYALWGWFLGILLVAVLSGLTQTS